MFLNRYLIFTNGLKQKMVDEQTVKNASKKLPRNVGKTCQKKNDKEGTKS